MAEDDIYKSKGKFERFLANLNSFALPPEEREHRCPWAKTGKYWCKNSENLVHFKRMAHIFEARDCSYVRRNRNFQTLKFIVHHTEKELSTLDRDDINMMVAAMHKVYKSPRSKSDFIKDLKFFWKQLFPEKDAQGRLDETVVPYVVRHLNPNMDKSKQRLRNDRMSWEEFEKLVNYHSNSPMMQFYLTYSVESLIRPQEAFYLKLKNIELFDNYAKILIAEHGKEGTGLTLSIDSFPYLVKWLEVHPTKSEPESFLFVKDNFNSKGGQMTPVAMNKRLRRACDKLGIEKHITAYSLKRCGVTFKRLAGCSDMEIQHAARWTSTKQLKIYDQSTQDDAMRQQLVKRGLITPDKGEDNLIDKSQSKVCVFCHHRSPFTAITCEGCQRPLDREKIRQQAKEQEHSLQSMHDTIKELMQFKQMMEPLIQNFQDVKEYVRMVQNIQRGEQEIRRKAEKLRAFNI